MAPSATETTNGSAKKIDFTTFQNVINGKLVGSSKTRTGLNPATKKPNAPVPVATSADLDTAVDAARTAFVSWSQTPISERKAALKAYAKGIQEYEDEFTKLLTTEQGKPLMFAKMEIGAAIKWTADIPDLNLEEEIVDETEEKKTIIRYTPLGVVGAIVPWNFPVHLAAGKIAPALYTGNCIIIKPSPFTPYCALKLAELAQAYFPPGVVQALSGDDSLGPQITLHPGIDKISFTGSTATGKKVMESASKTLKRVTLELGGNDPAIVCKSVDIPSTAAKIATLGFMNSGQVCLCLKRIYIHSSIYDEFRDAMVAFTKTLKVGNGMEEGTFLGPIQNSMQYERVQGFFADAEKDGEKFAVGGRHGDTEGYYIQPAIIDNPKEDSRFVVEEPFGPIIPILPWTEETDVITRANDTKMGLGASVWSTDLAEAERIAKQLHAGNVWINAHAEVSPNAPFGGHKESGIGSEWGLVGLKSFCNTQSLFLLKK